MPRKKKFGDVMWQWRYGLSLDRQRAADLLGVPRRTLEGWENGRLPPHPSVLAMAMRYLELRIRNGWVDNGSDVDLSRLLPDTSDDIAY